MIDLTPEQQSALKLMLNPRRPVESVTGPAGAGKSSVLARAAQDNPTAAVLAPTNKAAIVLRQKGIARATTIHSVLYTPTEIRRHRKDATSDATLYQKDANGANILDQHNQPIPEISSTDIAFDLRQDGDTPFPTTAFIDESSMLAESVLADLHATFKHVVLIGDKFQLPPVKSKDVFALHPPSVELTEVHRTALESPILRWVNSMRIARQVLPPATDDYALRTCGYTNAKLFKSIVANECQAVCFSNRLRHTINERIRSERALPPFQLKAGETLVCLDNIRLTVEGRQTLKFYNGEVVTLAEDGPTERECRGFYDPVALKFTNGKSHRVWPFWMDGFWNEYDSARWKNTIFRMRQLGELYGAPLTADMAYALTAHKAQGSEWNNVVVFNQSATMIKVLGPLMQTRWLYTAGSRAKQRLLVVEC